MINPRPSEWMTRAEAMGALEISERTLDRLVSEGKIGKLKHDGHTWIDRDSVIARMTTLRDAMDAYKEMKRAHRGD
jgi:predicted site-specific integrase-resolvase